MRTVMLAILIVLLSGCGKARPIIVGGQPVSYWVQELENPDARVRKQAVFKLGNVGPEVPAVYRALVESLNDNDARVRCEAILALLKLGPRAREAIADLTRVQDHDPDRKVREYAARALEKLSSNL